MRRKPSFWSLLILLCLGGAVCFWGLRKEREPREVSRAKVPPRTAAAANANRNNGTNRTNTTHTKSATNNTNVAAAKGPHSYRLSNTTEPLGKLVHNDKAILLANALIDTSKPLNLQIPERLRGPASGSYMVQSSGPLNDQFRALLQRANATIVSYIPNNAYLVRVSEAGAQQIAADVQTQSVLPYEPYYKLDGSLLKMAMENPNELPLGAKLNLTLFSDAYDATISSLQQLGAQVVAQNRSPFGPLVTVQAATGTLSEIAGLPGVQAVAAVHSRVHANDLDRQRLGVSVDTLVTTNYLGLSGSNVLVNINDSGVDENHPDLQNRIFTQQTSPFFPPSIALNDYDGHGTHVAGTILGNGTESSTMPTNPPGSVLGANFRGMAPNANAFVLPILAGSNFLFSVPDWYLQESAAETNALISNNSWNYADDFDYDIAAASYDAAVRDALPEVTGSQPVLFVFSAGNQGGGYDDGTGGSQDTILSPATAKNVITVGAIEQQRFITNQVVVDGVTNNELYAATDNQDQVASFSGRGNVGLNVEGDFGRFKPDLVAPGTFVISDRSEQWNTNVYYSPTNDTFYFYTNNVVGTDSNVDSFVFPISQGTISLTITLLTNALTGSTSLPPMPIYVGVNAFPQDNSSGLAGTNQVTLPPPTINSGDTLYFDVGNDSQHPVNFDVEVDVKSTNDVGDYYLVLSNMNNKLGPWYRYESGTSMAAAGVSGMLALMQEFFQQRLHVTNSPAMMKALLINGARGLSDQYDFAVNNANLPTFQGWGLPNLPNTIPPVLNNGGDLTKMPLQFFDQNPTNALATGQSFTRNLNFTGDTTGQDLRITLVWTDPPGNPQAGVKLVNDLDLIVSNNDTGEVFFGNDIPVGSSFNEAWDTNGPPNIDSVNNVENVFLSGPLSTNYSITVLGRRVNVNAVTGNTNNVVQDYALVVSCGDASSENNLFTLTPANGGNVASNSPLVTNVMTLSNNVPVLNQRVGANSQYTYTYTGITNTNGTPAQWNFYIYTNTPALTNGNFTNVAFVTFAPPNLGLPRAGALNEIAPPDQDATRFAGADIDMYVSTDPSMTNVSNPALMNAAINGASKSLGRIGNEVVFFTNSTPGEVYYIGIKSEDQQAAQYNLIGFATDVPFSQTDTNGNAIVNMNTVPLVLPSGSPTKPNSAFLIGICINAMEVRKVVVTNSITCPDFGDFIGSLTEGGKAAVLNNHSVFTNSSDATETLVYDDSGESEFPNAITSAGPGSLQNFAGVNAMGSAWTYTIVNDSSSTTGTINYMTLLLEKQYPPNSGYHRIPPLLANAWYYGFVDVPANATNLTISVAGNTGPLDFYIQEGSPPTPALFQKELLNATNVTLSISKYDTPPLNAGRYWFAIHTHNAEPNLSVDIELQYDLNPAGGKLFFSQGNVPLLDDAVTYSTNDVDADSTIVSADVGVRIIHPRESDLVLTLISPQGTRVLLAENRGGTDTNGYGSGTNIFLSYPQQSSGGATTATNVIQVGANAGIVNVSYNMYSIPDELAIFYDGAKIFDTGMVSGSNMVSVPFGPGNSQNVIIVMNLYGNSATNGDLWDYTVNVTAQNLSYAVFSENTNITQTPIKFAVPPFGGGPAYLAAQTNASSSFEGIATGSYPFGSTIPFSSTSPFFSWTVSATNSAIPTTPTVVTVPALAGLGGDGSNVLALHGGTITTVLPTKAGYKYTLAFSKHGRPALNPISWWNADNNTDDSVDGNSLVDLSTNPVVYAPGVVGQAFSLNGNVKLRAPDATNLYLTNAITIEGWVNSQSDNTASILMRGDSRSGFDPYTLGVAPSGVGGQCDLQWQVTDTNDNSTLLVAPMNLNVFTHVAGTYYWNGTNSSNATMKLYVNGLPLAVVTNTLTVPIGALIPGFDPGLGVGNRADLINGFAFTGLIDELSLYNVGLSDAQVQDVYAAGSAGKDPVDETPPVTADVIFEGQTNEISGIDEWDTVTYTFTAPTNNMTLTFVPHEDGMLIDAIQLIQDIQPNPVNYYLPEESLAKLAGENSLGTWQLEVMDNRVGATNPQPTLVSWELNLTLTDKIPYAIPVNEGQPVTNTVAPGNFAYFQVYVPPWASYATNILTASGPVNFWFNQSTEPTGTGFGDVELFTQQAGGTVTLATNGSPPLVPGNTYYLGVQNTGATPVNLTLEVDFNITVLTNKVPVTNTLPAGGVPRYYEFTVDTNAVSSLFQIINPSGNVILVASKGTPLPNTTNFDYISAVPGASPQNILVLTNSTPVPLGPGAWYLGVYNNDVGPVSYTIEASEQGPPNIIVLTNGIPFTNTAPPGPDVTTFYEFDITTNVPAALFELYKLNGNVDLTLDRGTLPYAPPYFGSSFNPGTNREQIVIRTNLLGTNIVSSWFLAVPNETSSNVTYTIRAVVSTNGLLISGVPITVTATPPPPGSTYGPTLNWPGVPGEWYEVQATPNILTPTPWPTIATFEADGENVTYTDPTPITNNPAQFYRILQIPAP